jgi:PPOX class probable F420-dependent enzyme
MEISDVQKFLADNHRGVLVAHKRDGRPQMTLVTPAIDSEGRVIVHSRADSYKVKNVRRDPRVSMLVMGEQYSGSKYVQLHGTAEIVPQPEAMDLLIFWYRQVRGEHPNWEEYREKMKEEGQIVLRINIEAVNASR